MSQAHGIPPAGSDRPASAGDAGPVSRADAVLAALDPEQRAVASEPRGPDVCHRGSGHRQDAGHHPPDRLRGPLGRLPAAAGPRGDLHRPRRR
ncbi:MAG: hypothetical protein V9F04_10865 [Dermatophilaceae bacterium]